MGEVEAEEGDDQIKALATIEQSEWTFRHSYPSAQRNKLYLTHGALNQPGTLHN